MFIFLPQSATGSQHVTRYRPSTPSSSNYWMTSLTGVPRFDNWLAYRLIVSSCDTLANITLKFNRGFHFGLSRYFVDASEKWTKHRLRTWRPNCRLQSSSFKYCCSRRGVTVSYRRPIQRFLPRVSVQLWQRCAQIYEVSLLYAMIQIRARTFWFPNWGHNMVPI